MGRLFKIYLAVMILIITLLLGTLVGGIIYADQHVQVGLNKAEAKINTLNQNLTNVNSQLNGINNKLSSDSSTILP